MQRKILALFVPLIAILIASNAYSEEDLIVDCKACLKTYDRCNCPISDSTNKKNKNCNYCNANPCCCEFCDCDFCSCEECDFTPPCPPSVCAYNAPEIIDLKCPWNTFATLSFLYWEAKQDNLDIGYTQDNQNNNQSRRIIGMDFSFDPGFKIGLGTSLCKDSWKAYAEYTWFHQNNSKGVSVAANQSFFPYWLYFNDNGNFDTSTMTDFSSKWDVDLDMLDLTVRRKYYVGQCLIFDTFFGLRFAWIDQELKNSFRADSSFFGSGSPQANFFIDASTCSWSVGPRIGLDTMWNLCNGFYLFGNANASILYTDYDAIDVKESITPVTSGPTPASESLKSDCDQCFLRPNTEMFIGAGWKSYICCNDWHVDFQLGYSASVFWNQNMFPLSIDQGNEGQGEPYIQIGDLYLHGLTITARLDF